VELGQAGRLGLPKGEGGGVGLEHVHRNPLLGGGALKPGQKAVAMALSPEGRREAQFSKEEAVPAPGPLGVAKRGVDGAKQDRIFAAPKALKETSPVAPWRGWGPAFFLEEGPAAGQERGEGEAKIAAQGDLHPR
jgi:hypothetical protein